MAAEFSLYNAVTDDEDTGFKYLDGWNVRETTGTTAAVFRIRDGSVSGAIAVSVNLNPGESSGTEYPRAITANAAGAWYFEKVSGTLEGAVYGRN